MKPPSLICLVSDRHRLSPGAGPAESIDRLITFIGTAARCGVDLIQVRERDLSARQLAELTARSVDLAGEASRIVVNDRLDVALAAGAHGVHLRSDSVNATTVREITAPGFLVGRSVHGVSEAVEASRGGRLDYVVFGAVFATASKTAGHPVAGVHALAEVCTAIAVPVLAIGGITPDRIEVVVGSGAAGVAAIGLFVPPSNVPFDRHLTSTVEMLRRAFDTRRVVS